MESQQPQGVEVEPTHDDDLNSDVNDYGFVPLGEERSEKPKEVETPEMKEFKDKINTLLCRYPGLIPRTSSAVMARLDSMSVDELRNVYTNCINDISMVRGTPSAEMFIIGVTHWFQDKVPNYTEACLEDEELKRDIESEFISIFGFLNTKLNIIFRFLNNAYSCIRESQNLGRNNLPSPLFHAADDDDHEFGDVSSSQAVRSILEDDEPYADEEGRESNPRPRKRQRAGARS